MKCVLAAAALFSLMMTAARAEPHAAAYAAYAAGDYARAVDLARAAGRAEDLALAARALNAVSYFDRERKSARRTADDAIDLAEQAIALDPTLPEAHLQTAIGLALKGARTSPVKAFFSGLAAKARREIDKALALDADNPWALSTSAAWRIEVARRGGGALYGADPEQGHIEFMKARALATDNPAIAYECALRLLADGREEWRADALAALDAALAAAPATKFEADVIALARDFKAAIAQGPDAERAFIARQP
ncbi:MAG: hypothetical protein ACOZAA_11930 [Pseudomonadota bacterium]